MEQTRKESQRAQIRALLAANAKTPFTSNAVSHTLAMSKSTVRHYLWLLHKAGAIHICAWQSPCSKSLPPPPIYRFGPGVDAQKPRKSPEEIKEAKRNSAAAWYRRKKGPVVRKPLPIHSIPSSVFDLANHI